MADESTAAEGAVNETAPAPVAEVTEATGGPTFPAAPEVTEPETAEPVAEAAPGEPEPMMQVKLTISLAGEPCHAAGSEISMPQSEAIRAIEAGYATPVDAKKGKVETR